MNHASNPYALAAIAFFGFSIAIWILIQTIRGLRAGKLRYSIFLDDRKPKPVYFWSNVIIRFFLIGALTAGAIVMLESASR